MNGVRTPDSFRWERLAREHPRSRFRCGEPEVDAWLRTKAWQHQKKHLSATQVLLAPDARIAGYYTLATGQVDFAELPDDLARKLPRRALPIAILAWLGVATNYQGQGMGKILVARALRDCYEAGATFLFVAVLLDCLNEDAKRFYGQWDFQEVPGHPYRLLLGYRHLAAMMRGAP